MRGLDLAAFAVLLPLLATRSLPAAAAGSAAATPRAGDAAPPDTLTLTQAVRIALGEAPDLRAERANREGVAGQRPAAWGAFLPRLGADASFSRSDFTTLTFAAPEGTSRELDGPRSGVRKSSRQSVGLRWTLLDGGRRIAEWRAGGARADAARHRVSAAERATIADVRVAYIEALKQRRLVEVARRRLEARRRDLERARRRYAVADAGRSEILGARSDTLDARMTMLEARDLARVRTRALGEAMGVDHGRLPAGAPLAPLGALPQLVPLDPAALARRAVRSHPELDALSADVRAASSDLWAARSEYLPTVSLRYDLSRSETLGPEGSFFVLDPSNHQKGLTLGISWNLFGGFRREAEKARASADLRAARARRAKRRLELETAVRDLAAALERRRGRLVLLRRKEELARQRVEVTRERFRLGDASYLELQQVTERLAGAERDRVIERYDYLRAWAELERRTGPLQAAGLPPPDP